MSIKKLEDFTQLSYRHNFDRFNVKKEPLLHETAFTVLKYFHCRTRNKNKKKQSINKIATMGNVKPVLWLTATVCRSEIILEQPMTTDSRDVTYRKLTDLGFRTQLRYQRPEIGCSIGHASEAQSQIHHPNIGSQIVQIMQIIDNKEYV